MTFSSSHANTISTRQHSALIPGWWHNAADVRPLAGGFTGGCGPILDWQTWFLLALMSGFTPLLQLALQLPHY